jgi:vitellogenic carboxypeptidase-like protein
VEQGIAQLYQALLNFFDRHPELLKNPLILAGESYAGTYLPLLAQAIVEGNRKGYPHIDLRQITLCDAWVDPMVQMSMDTAWAFSHGLISAAQKQWLDSTYADRLPEINAAIQQLCGLYMTNTAQQADPPFKPIYDYLNTPAVRKALHIPPEYPKMSKNWSQAIADNYQSRVNDSYRPVLQALMDGNPDLKVQVISGLNDAKDCNFLGTGAWLDRMQGPAAYAFQSAPARQWTAGGKEVLGLLQDGGQLSWLKVLNAGHMCVRDQPQLVHHVLSGLAD